VLAGPNVGLGWTDKLGTLKDLPEQVEDEEDGDVDVGSEEVLVVKVPFLTGWVDEDGESVEDDDDGEEDESKPGSIWLEAGPEDQSVAVNTLGNESFAEANVGKADGDPGEELSNGDNVLEPVEDGKGVVGDGKVGQARDEGSEGDGIDWNTLLCALEEDLGRLSVLGNTKEITGTRVQKGVGRRRGRGENDGIDEVVKTLDS